MEWSDDAFMLSIRRHGEASVLARLLTREHGVHAGLVRGGAGKRLSGVLQPGNRVHATWRARLPEHLGVLSMEPSRAHAAAMLSDPIRLACLGAACAVALTALPERQPHPGAFEGLSVLLETLENNGPWASVYVKWELGVLAELGFGLDLSQCAATGATETLTYVSPRSGRAVSQSAGEPYRARLFPLPRFLLETGASGSRAEVLEGLRLTGHFLEHHALHGRSLPAARSRLLARLEREPMPS